MNRRGFLSGLATLAGACLIPGAATASLVCQEDATAHTETCAIGVFSDKFEGVYAPQENTMWCWAACLHMLFRYYGFEVSQARIVEETWGKVVNFPAYMEQIIAATNRKWVTDDGKAFRAFGQFFNVKIEDMAADLTRGAPLIVALPHHAVVLTGLGFTDGAGQERIDFMTVRDPWPGKGRRNLTPEEQSAIGSMLRVSVFDAAGTPVTRTPAPCEKKVTACTHPSHPDGDLLQCQHVCQGPTGPVPCHVGDTVPCQHVCPTQLGPAACHPVGDRVACTHPMHPQGDTLLICR